MRTLAAVVLTALVSAPAFAQSHRGRISSPPASGGFTSDGGTYASTATAPIVVTAGDISCTAAGALTGGCLTRSAGNLVIDAGFVNTSSNASTFAGNVTVSSGIQGATIVSTTYLRAVTYLQVGGIIYLGAGPTVYGDAATAPTLSGFAGSAPSASVTAHIGSFSFDVNVGGTAPGSTGTITFPATTTGWWCDCGNLTTPTALNIIKTTSSTTTTCVISQLVVATNGAANWGAQDHLRCSARGL